MKSATLSPLTTWWHPFAETSQGPTAIGLHPLHTTTPTLFVVPDAPDVFETSSSLDLLHAIIGIRLATPIHHHLLIFTKYPQHVPDWWATQRTYNWTTYLTHALRAFPDIESYASEPLVIEALSTQPWPPPWLHFGIRMTAEPAPHLLTTLPDLPFLPWSLWIEPFRTRQDLTQTLPFLNWVILGTGHTPTPPRFIEALSQQCQNAAIPFYFTGWKSWIPHRHIAKPQLSPHDLHIDETAFPNHDATGWDVLHATVSKEEQFPPGFRFPQECPDFSTPAGPDSSRI